VDTGRGQSKGKTKSIGRTRSPATINRYKAALSAIFEYGKERYNLSDNPCRRVKARTENNGRIRFLSGAEQAALREQCRASDWSLLYLLVLMALTTGARQGELLRLRWRDLKLVERRAYVGDSKNGEPRVLPLVNGVVTELTRLPRPLDADLLLFPASHDPHQAFEFRQLFIMSLLHGAQSLPIFQILVRFFGAKPGV